jgi:hypothetical protein
MWKVFVDDPDTPGRFNLIAETPSRPAGDALDVSKTLIYVTSSALVS